MPSGVSSNYVDAVPLEPKRVKRVACTCPNCAMSINARAINPDGTPKNKRHLCHFIGCNKVFGEKTQLELHLRCHTEGRPFICGWPYCGMRFTQSGHLQRHMRIHTGEKPFKCYSCGKRFMRNDQLHRHASMHQKPDESGEAESSSSEIMAADSTEAWYSMTQQEVGLGMIELSHQPPPVLTHPLQAYDQPPLHPTGLAALPPTGAEEQHEEVMSSHQHSHPPPFIHVW